MTEKMNQQIKIPVWATGIILTLFLTLMSFTVSISANNQEMRSDISTNKRDISMHEIEVKDQMKHLEEELEKKASEEKVDLIYQTVLRLEDKIDKLK